MSEQIATESPEAPEVTEAPAPPPKMKMVVRAQNWSVKARVNRSGREVGESVFLYGHIFAPTIDPNTPLSTARAEIKLKSAQDRMSVKIGRDETFLLLPLEDFAMERLVAKIKELSGNFGLEVGVEFEASETTDRQLVEFADFTFSSGAPAATPKKPAAAPQAQAPKAPAAQAPAAQAPSAQAPSAQSPSAQAPAAQAPAGSPAAVTR